MQKNKSTFNLLYGNRLFNKLQTKRNLLLNSPFYAALGILLNLRSSLQAIGEKLLPLISSIIELIGKIVFVIVVIPSLEYFGVIICESVIWCLMCLQLVYSFYRNPYI